MAGLLGVLSFDAVALTASTAKTVAQLDAASNHRVRLVEIGLFFDGATSAVASVLCELVRQTTDGTMTAVTLVKVDPDAAETLQSTGSKTATAEPTTTDVLKYWRVHPQAGAVVQFADYLGNGQVIKGGAKMGLRLTAPNNVNVTGYIRFEE